MTYFIFDYVRWHYGRSLSEGYAMFKNFEWFVYQFFSVPILLNTFFDKFERLGEEYRKGSGASGIFEAIIVNTLMRLVGMCFRTVLIFVGIVCMMFIALFFIVFGIIWIVLPLLVPVSLFIGLILII